MVLKLNAEKDDDDWDDDERIQYVNDKEIYYLLAKTSNDNNQRIIYLFNTYESNQLPDMSDVLEVAISLDNEKLASKLVISGVEPSEVAFRSAINAEMSSLVKTMLKLQPDAIVQPAVQAYYLEEFGEADFKAKLRELYATTSSAYTKDDILKLAYAKGYTEFNNLQKERLNDEVKELSSSYIPSRPPLGTVKSDHYGKLPSEYNSYRDAISAYNSQCTNLIMTAMEQGHPEIAKRVLAKMKPNIEWTELGDWAHVVEHEMDVHSVYNAFKVFQTNNEIDETRKLIK